MKKNKLIEILSKIEGNPDILLWNGMVWDWMDIKKEVFKSSLVKLSKDYYMETLKTERKIDAKDWELQFTDEEEKGFSKGYKTCEWHDNSWVTQEDITEKRYLEKPIYYLEATSRGISTWDRLGSIKY